MKKLQRSKNQAQVKLNGPSLYEVLYLKQVKEELEIFLKSKNFSTIQKFDLVFSGQDYRGHIDISA